MKVKVRVLKGKEKGEGGGEQKDGKEEELLGEVEGEGEEVECEVYEWIGPKEALEDQEWDFDEFVRMKMKAFVREDEGFQDVEG